MHPYIESLINHCIAENCFCPNPNQIILNPTKHQIFEKIRCCILYVLFSVRSLNLCSGNEASSHFNNITRIPICVGTHTNGAAILYSACMFFVPCFLHCGIACRYIIKSFECKLATTQ